MANLNNNGLGINISCVIEDAKSIETKLNTVLKNVNAKIKISNIDIDETAIKNKLKNILGVLNGATSNIPLNDFKNTIESLQNVKMDGISTSLFATGYGGEFTQLNKQVAEAEKLANAMGKVREQSELRAKAEEKANQVSQAKAQNKVLDDNYKQAQDYENFWLKALSEKEQKEKSIAESTAQKRIQLEKQVDDFWQKALYDREQKEKASQEKLTEAMANGREKSQINSNSLDKKTELEQANAINKALEEEYAERQKLAEVMAKGRENSELKAKDSNRQAELEQSKAINKELENEYNENLKLAESMAKVREQSEIKAKAQENKASLAQTNAMNKALEENYKLEQNLADAMAKGREKSEIKTKEVDRKNELEQAKAVNQALEQNYKEQEKLRQEYEKMGSTASEYAQKTNIALNNLGTKYGNSIPTKELADFKAKLESIKNLNIGGKPIESMEQLKKIISETKIEYASLDSVTRQNAGGFLGTMAHNLSGFASFYLGAGGIITAINAIKSGISDVANMDNALVNLNKVVDMSSQQMLEMKDSAIEMGKALGKSASDIVAGMAEFGRVTKNLDEIKELTKVATMASTVTDLSVADASKALNTSMITFNINAKDSMQILDSWNEIKCVSPYTVMCM